MAIEVEMKFPIRDLLAARHAIAKTGAREVISKRQVDRYFNHPSRDFAQTDEAVRIRKDGAENRITYKGPKLDAATKSRKEIEIVFADGEDVAAQMAEMLASLGFREVRSVAKTREVLELEWNDVHIEIGIDEVDGLGWFVELEATADTDSFDAVRGHLLAFADDLGLGACERRSYLQLLLGMTAS